MPTTNPRSTKVYWNERVKNAPKIDWHLVFDSTRFEEMDKNHRQILSLFKDKKVLDFGCGYGRMSDMFENYTGIDFSEEMIKLAKEKYPDKRFEMTTDEKFDVVFAVMCLSSLGITAQEFAKRWDAPTVIVLEPFETNIFYK